MLLLGGCADGRASAEPPAVSVGDIAEQQYFHEGDYLGRQVTVGAQVTDVLGPRSFELAARAYGDDSLLVQTRDPVAVRQGQRVEVVGTVGQYHVYMPDQVPPVNHDNYEKYETEAYLYGSTVRAPV